MKILVTGGSGFLGTHLREYFGADDFSRKANRDVLNLQDAAVVQDYDVVIHLAAELDKSPENAESVFLTNVEGTINVLESAFDGATLLRFAANYQLQCAYAARTYGEVRFNSTLPFTFNEPPASTTPDPLVFPARTFVTPPR